MTTDQMRAEFETWALRDLYPGTTHWRVWQAAYAAGQKAEQAEAERLRDERESVIRLGPHPAEQVDMPLDVFIKTRFVPVWEFNELADKAERLRAEVQRLDIAGTHTCHDDCPKLPCVQRREIERLKRDLHAAKFGRTSRKQKDKTPPAS